MMKIHKKWSHINALRDEPTFHFQNSVRQLTSAHIQHSTYYKFAAEICDISS